MKRTFLIIILCLVFIEPIFSQFGNYWWIGISNNSDSELLYTVKLKEGLNTEYGHWKNVRCYDDETFIVEINVRTDRCESFEKQKLPIRSYFEADTIVAWEFVVNNNGKFNLASEWEKAIFYNTVEDIIIYDLSENIIMTKEDIPPYLLGGTEVRPNFTNIHITNEIVEYGRNKYH